MPLPAATAGDEGVAEDSRTFAADAAGTADADVGDVAEVGSGLVPVATVEPPQPAAVSRAASEMATRPGRPPGSPRMSYLRTRQSELRQRRPGDQHRGRRPAGSCPPLP
ncbi:hypothetical protein FRAAL3246 [Frankia alni ACN14a]|uniref:Uncharacterized protein n=1 Tax=Frankia alni (strain DSM 45986 / CECT 9034 / ACN14a) TaxID=326424 RepID=Q0RKR5_FRAAA|nr:hypothetical protein FRAAL3246 [Frankia alni ACN14a]